jgi:hypothetical protein
MKRLTSFLALTFLLIPSISLAQHLFKCTDSNGSIVFSQTPCGDTQTETWVEPMPNMGVKGDNQLSNPDGTSSSEQSTTKSLKDEVSRINKAANESIKEVWGKKKTNSVSVVKIIASMEINRLKQIASLPIYSEADKQFLISNIDQHANRAVQNIPGTSVGSITAKAG